MTKVLQRLFKASAVTKIKQELASAKSLESYYDESWTPKDEDVWSTEIQVPEGAVLPILDGASWHHSDCQNAIALFEYYSFLDETQASDSRFWAYLSHVQYRGYSFNRWAKPKDPDKLLNDQNLQIRAVNRFMNHWFTSDSSRSLRRHSIARLWWAVKLTRSPWEVDSDYESFDKGDPYVLTRALFLTQDVYQAVLERNLGRSKEVLFAALDFIGRHPEFSKKKPVGHLTKGLNLEYGVRKLSNLNREELLWLLEQIASEYVFTEDDKSSNDPEDEESMF